MSAGQRTYYRGILNERRRDRLATLRIMADIVALEQLGPSDPALLDVISDARAFLEDAVRDTAEFAAMARAARVVHFQVSLP